MEEVAATGDPSPEVEAMGETKAFEPEPPSEPRIDPVDPSPGAGARRVLLRRPLQAVPSSTSISQD